MDVSRRAVARAMLIETTRHNNLGMLHHYFDRSGGIPFN
jgi:hypothetical protein